MSVSIGPRARGLTPIVCTTDVRPPMFIRPASDPGRSVTNFGPRALQRLALGGLVSGECKDAGKALAIIREPRPLLNPAINAFGWTDRDITTRSFADAVNINDYGEYGCVVITSTPSNPSSTPGAAIVQKVRDSYGFQERRSFGSKTTPLQAVVLTRG